MASGYALAALAPLDNTPNSTSILARCSLWASVMTGSGGRTGPPARPTMSMPALTTAA